MSRRRQKRGRRPQHPFPCVPLPPPGSHFPTPLSLSLGPACGEESAHKVAQSSPLSHAEWLEVRSAPRLGPCSHRSQAPRVRAGGRPGSPAQFCIHPRPTHRPTTLPDTPLAAAVLLKHPRGGGAVANQDTEGASSPRAQPAESLGARCTPGIN